MRRRRAIVLALFTLTGIACSNSTTTPGDDGKADAPAGEVLAGDLIFLDTGTPKLDVVDLRVAEVLDVADTHQPQCGPGEGCFLDKCGDNKVCQSGWCVQHMGESVCSETCQEECPAGWSCQQVAGTDPDVVYICVSSYANLCRPCSTNDNCKSVGGAEDACIDYGPDGNFCGGPCGDAEECPWGFSCKDVITVEGSSLQQCVNDTGECPCTDSSVALGLTTPCDVTNELGTCTGKRTCTEESLTACDAASPAEETCNGLDDDCDGEVDEPALVDGDYVNLCNDDNDCTDDKCTGEEGCVNEVLVTGDCSDDNPCTVADHCVEGTCIGDPVECDDDNPCTDDVCTETGGCEYPPNTDQCDDGNPCTLADQCSDGKCTGTPANCDCLADADCIALEDGNVCNGSLMCDTSALPYKCSVDPVTVIACPESEDENAFCLKANCAPDTGECSFVPDHEDFLCDNADACTVNDKCVEGVCTGGSPVNCNDGNPCTGDYCADEGCKSLPYDDGKPCMEQPGWQCMDAECVCAGACEFKECGDDGCGGVCGTCAEWQGCQLGQCICTECCNDHSDCNGLELCTGKQNSGEDYFLDICEEVNHVFYDGMEGYNQGLFPASFTSHYDETNPWSVKSGMAPFTTYAGTRSLRYYRVAEDLGGYISFNRFLPDVSQSGFSLLSFYVRCSSILVQDAVLSVMAGDQVISEISPDMCENNWKRITADLSAFAGKTEFRFIMDNPDFGGVEYLLDEIAVLVSNCPSPKCVSYGLDGAECVVDFLGADSCFIDWECHAALAPQPDTECMACMPNLAQVIWSPSNALCDDDDACTDNACDPGLGCVTTLNDGLCNDDDLCSTGDHCHLGDCIGAGTLICDDGNECTDDSCNPAVGCQFVPNNAPCDDGNACTTGDTCGAGWCSGGDTCGALGLFCTDQGCLARDCADLLEKHPATESGVHWIKPDGIGPSEPIEVYCDMETDGGGWTLVAVSSDDGQDTWTWGNRHYWDTDTTTLGSLEDLNMDFKSRALHEALAGDILFRHYPSGIWAAYYGVEADSASLADSVSDVGGTECWQPQEGHVLSAGTLTLGERLCSTNLYFNAMDHDGNIKGDDCAWPSNESHTYGPSWNVQLNNGCPFDDPGTSSGLGPHAGIANEEYNKKHEYQSGYGAIGFGDALGLNAGEVGSGQNYMQVLVRPCTPSCEAKECGVDGCGGSCGECGAVEYCNSGQCASGCGGPCPVLDGFGVECNGSGLCEYSNEDDSGWKAWDVWIWIPPGTFPLGGPADEPGYDPAEGPIHEVTFAKGYFISKYEIVVEQYEACSSANPGKCTPASTVDWDGNGWGTNSSANNRSHHPQNGLTWQQARDFCGWVAPGGRLPSEAQWEYAAKGPVHRKYPWADSPLPTCTNNTATFNEAGEEGGYGCGLGGTSEAGSKISGTSWSGAMDMAGNLWEWCEDWWHPTYEGAPWDGSAWVDDGTWRVVRGGSFDTSAFHLRTSWRPYHTPTHRFANDGARCMRRLPEDCQPDCDGNECGEDGCGGSCGGCDAGFKCFEGQCAPLPLHLWSTSFIGTKSDNLQDVAVDGEGNSYLLGVYQSTTLLLGDDILSDELLENAGDTDMLLVKLDSEGELLWSNSIGGEEPEYPYSLSLDSQGNAYVVGDYSSAELDFGNGAVGNAGKSDVFLAKFSSEGVLAWSKTAGGSDYDWGREIAVLPNGDSYVAGSFKGESIDFGGGPLQNAGGDCGEIGCSDFFVSKISSGGLHLWSKSLGGNADDDCFSAVADDAGNIYVGGRVKSGQLQIGDDFVGSAGKGDVLVVKMTPAGEYVWGSAFGGDQDDTLYSLSSDAAGNVYLIGDFMSPSIDFGGGPLVNKGDQDIFLVKLDEDGKHVFSRSYGGSQRDNGYSVAVGNDGMVYFTGYFATQTINFGGDTFVLSGSKDLYLAKLNGAGEHIWSRQYGGTGDEWGWSLEIDASDNLLLGGCFRSPTIDFGGGPLVHSNNGATCDIFAAMLDQ